MPELPEVETIASRLRNGSDDLPSLLEHRINRVNLYWERTLATPSVDEFRERVIGQVIKDIWRRGKYLVFSLSEDFLLVHLRMSGDMLVDRNSRQEDPHQRLILLLDSGLRLVFIDPRKFGRVWLVSNPGEVLDGLGPEPLDGSFSAAEFHERLHSYRRQLKPLLLDQHFLAGLGNIYTDEALHLTRLHPLTISDTISSLKSEQLLGHIRQVLREGIRRNGTSIDWIYRGGNYQHHLRVYRRTGEPCPRCGAEIERILVGGRGTHICPNCQQLSGFQD